MIKCPKDIQIELALPVDQRELYPQPGPKALAGSSPSCFIGRSDRKRPKEEESEGFHSRDLRTHIGGLNGENDFKNGLLPW
jgi:hypothetical protein